MPAQPIDILKSLRRTFSGTYTLHSILCFKHMTFVSSLKSLSLLLPSACCKIASIAAYWSGKYSGSPDGSGQTVSNNWRVAVGRRSHKSPVT